MDFVPKATRARWQALDSVSSATWCGSAALGGVLCDRHGYVFTFYFTAALQFMGVLVRALLVFVVPLYEKEDARSSTGGEQDDGGGVAPLAAAGIINEGVRTSPCGTRVPTSARGPGPLPGDYETKRGRAIPCCMYGFTVLLGWYNGTNTMNRAERSPRAARALGEQRSGSWTWSASPLRSGPPRVG
eukprot:4992580-Prymnesium_polylepis.1